MRNNNYGGEPISATSIPKSKKRGIEKTNNKDNEKFTPPLDIPASSFRSCPETCEEMINTYGTYNIQPTANRSNDFPAIAQGTQDYMKKRPLEFFRDGDDENPASDTSDEHCM